MPYRDPFEEYFRRMMKKVFEDFDTLEKAFKIPEEPPKFIVRRPGVVRQAGGFSISISSNGKSSPKIDIRRFGPKGWEKIPQEVVTPSPRYANIAGGRIEETPKIAVPVGGEATAPIRHAIKPIKPFVPEKKQLPQVEKRVVAEFNVSIDINTVVISMNAPEVESRDNVRVDFYGPESVEVRAVSKKLNTEYLCPVAVPSSIDRQNATVEVAKDKVIVRIPRRIGG